MSLRISPLPKFEDPSLKRSRTIARQGAPIRHLVLVVSLLSLLWAPRALALDPARALAQFKHTAWTSENGAPSAIYALAQTRDGFLWLGTDKGLYRFDGSVFEKMPSGGPGQSQDIWALTATSTGELWIGHNWGGLSVYKDGRVSKVDAGPPHGQVRSIVEDRFGNVWVATSGKIRAELLEFTHGRWVGVGENHWSIPQNDLQWAFAARDGALWILVGAELYRLPVGAAKAVKVDVQLGAFPRVQEDAQGRLWVADSLGPRLLGSPPDKKTPVFIRGGDFYLNCASFLRDRDGSFWYSNCQDGLHRMVPNGPGASKVDTFAEAQGLTSASVLAIIEDREGNIWMGTRSGLDRFRPANVVAEAQKANQRSAAITQSGSSVYSTTFGRTVWKLGAQGAVDIASGEHLNVLMACPARGEGVWLLTNDNKFHLLDASKRQVLQGPAPKADFRSCFEDPLGRLWLAGTDGLFVHEAQRWRRYDLPTKYAAGIAFMAGDKQGRPILSFPFHGLIRVDGEKTQVIWRQDGPSIGPVHLMYATGAELLFSGGDGIGRYDGARTQLLFASRYPFLAGVSCIAQSHGDTWLMGSEGIVRIPTKQLEDAFEHQGDLYPLIFDTQDGMFGSTFYDIGNYCSISSDGRIWFVTNAGLMWVDPAHLQRNGAPPPVAIRSVIANGVKYELKPTLALRKGISDLQIDYAALSLARPERNRYRYRLVGFDRQWIDPGSRRQAIYTNIGPGHYTFRVIASNGDGLWNNTGAAVNLVIPPTFLQSRLFMILCAAAVCAVIWTLYSARVRFVSAQARRRFNERLEERSRIARELHDTLLQGIQGLILRFQSVAEQIPATHQARGSIEEALDRADKVLEESRNRVVDLRTANEGLDLAQNLESAARHLFADTTVSVKVIVEGAPRELYKVVTQEISRIGEEFLFNTLQHARAKHVRIAISYRRDKLVVSLGDDGVGIDPAVLERGSRDGHFGLPGMRERANRVGADCALESRLGAGVTLTIALAAKAAYAAHSRFAWFFPTRPNLPSAAGE